jgi:hypothetical protein
MAKHEGRMVLLTKPAASNRSAAVRVTGAGGPSRAAAAGGFRVPACSTEFTRARYGLSRPVIA